MFFKYKTTTRQGYKEYVCDKEICSNCRFKDKCLTGKSEFRTIRQYVWEEYKDKNIAFLKTDKGKKQCLLTVAVQNMKKIARVISLFFKSINKIFMLKTEIYYENLYAIALINPLICKIRGGINNL
ncbi:hypothetical protein TCEA9_22340 [Thermobrachium celere]|nr:hypothetical protein TCEA9_22340 [Thermobrachium celere]